MLLSFVSWGPQLHAKANDLEEIVEDVLRDAVEHFAIKRGYFWSNATTRENRKSHVS